MFLGIQVLENIDKRLLTVTHKHKRKRKRKERIKKKKKRGKTIADVLKHNFTDKRYQRKTQTVLFRNSIEHYVCSSLLNTQYLGHNVSLS